MQSRRQNQLPALMGFIAQTGLNQIYKKINVQLKIMTNAPQRKGWGLLREGVRLVRSAEASPGMWHSDGC